eukprot:9323281-Ditylum_brightwellii.AAC.1
MMRQTCSHPGLGNIRRTAQQHQNQWECITNTMNTILIIILWILIPEAHIIEEVVEEIAAVLFANDNKIEGVP